MRCLALTSERRRCSADAIDATGNCDIHQRVTPRLEDAATKTRISPQRRKAQALSLFSAISLRAPRGRDDSRRSVVPDDAGYNIPKWLKKSPTPIVIEQLLNSRDFSVRWLAAFTLRRRREPAAIEPLWQVLQHDRASFVRQQAAVALGKIGTPAVLPPLIEALWHDPDIGVRQACAIALGNLRDPNAARDLADVLKKERAVFVRWDCVLALGQVGDRTCEPLLRDLATKERAEVVRRACDEARQEIFNRE